MRVELVVELMAIVDVVSTTAASSRMAGANKAWLPTISHASKYHAILFSATHLTFISDYVLDTHWVHTRTSCLMLLVLQHIC